MGGKEASRGFLYQGFASVLEALTDKGNWDKIYVEFPTSNDKVDIALEQQNQIVKCIQVKSTINQDRRPVEPAHPGSGIPQHRGTAHRTSAGNGEGTL